MQNLVGRSRKWPRTDTADDASGVQDLRVGSKYRLVRRLGAGTFGAVYLGTNIEADQEVAIKLEHQTIDPSYLRYEIDIYTALSGRPGFPKVYWSGWQDDYRVLVFELLGPNLEDLFWYCGNRFSLKTTLMIVHQLLYRFECLHNQHFLHRDVKPDNFLLGVGKRGNHVYMTDLGLAVYHDSTRGDSQGVPVSKPQLVGTARYASINGHLEREQSRRDDLESLGYMLIYFMKGILPWQGLTAATHEQQLQAVLQKKQETEVMELCADLPIEFATYMNYVRSLRFEDKPRYAYLRQLFDNLFRRQGFTYDNVFDWTVLEYRGEGGINLEGASTRNGHTES
ncbi:MAG: hypothetical protein M1817_003272 [Caeruleum heppii]|nr:MAG: hypothetical protein M1817_003272 [Caeruleum heppii]